MEQERASSFFLHHLNSRGKPFTGFEVFVNLIAGTPAKSGITVHSELDTLA
jgi:hypothetical protein